MICEAGCGSAELQVTDGSAQRVHAARSYQLQSAGDRQRARQAFASGAVPAMGGLHVLHADLALRKRSVSWFSRKTPITRVSAPSACIRLRTSEICRGIMGCSGQNSVAARRA